MILPPLALSVMAPVNATPIPAPATPLPVTIMLLPPALMVIALNETIGTLAVDAVAVPITFIAFAVIAPRTVTPALVVVLPVKLTTPALAKIAAPETSASYALVEGDTTVPVIEISPVVDVVFVVARAL